MPRAGDGSYSLPPNTAAVPNQIASSTAYNDLAADIASELTNSLSRDGQGAMRANLGFGGFKGSNAAAGTLTADIPTVNQLQTQKVAWADSGGTVDAITVTYSPNITALVDGQRWRFRATGANTSTTPTLALGTTAAKTIVKANNVALTAGDIPGDNYECEGVYNASLDKHVLLNPIVQTDPTPTLAGNNTFTGSNTFNETVTVKDDLIFPITTLTAATNVALDLSTGVYFVLTIDRNSTLSNPTGDVQGQEFWLRVIQDGSSHWTLDFDTQYLFPNGVAEQIDPGNNAQTLYRGFVRAADNVILKRMWMSARNSIGFFKEYDLSTFAVDTTYTQAHGLGDHPALVQAYLECTSADLNYSAGDRVAFHSITNGGGSNFVPVVVTDATNVKIITASTNRPFILDKTARTDTQITSAKWKIILRIYE